MRALEFITGHMVYNLAYMYLNLTDDNHPGQYYRQYEKLLINSVDPMKNLALIFWDTSDKILRLGFIQIWLRHKFETFLTIFTKFQGNAHGFICIPLELNQSDPGYILQIAVQAWIAQALTQALTVAPSKIRVLVSSWFMNWL